MVASEEEIVRFLKTAKSISGFAPIFAGFTGFVLAIEKKTITAQVEYESSSDMSPLDQEVSYIIITVAFWLFIGITWHTFFIQTRALKGHKISQLKPHLDFMGKFVLPFAIVSFFFGMLLKMFLIGLTSWVPIVFSAVAGFGWVVYAILCLLPWSIPRWSKHTVDQADEALIIQLLIDGKIW